MSNSVAEYDMKSNYTAARGELIIQWEKVEQLRIDIPADLLEEIVGEFTTAPSDTHKEIHPQEDGSYLIDGTLSIRELNRLFNWKLATNGPKTVNGLVTEYLETIPEAGTSLLLDNHPIEVVQTTSSSIKTVRIDPRLKKGGERVHNDEKGAVIPE